VARAQHIIDICERRMGGGPVVMFHGTSSVFLRSILKQGFIPDPREKRWADDSNAGWHRSSRASFPGTYFTENVTTAMSSATNTTSKFGGNSVYVVALIQQRSGLVDEDYIVSVIETGTLNNTSNIAELWKDLHGDSEGRYRSTDYIRKVYARWLKDVVTRLDINERSISQPVMQELFIAIVTRKAAYLGKQTSSYVTYGLTLPEPREAEQRYRKALDVFIHKVKALATNYRKGFPPRETFMHNVRITEPVTYRGHNRILAVYEEVGGRDSGELLQLKIHYGKPIPEFEKDFKQRWGNFVWV